MKPFLYSFFHTETNDRSEKGMVIIPKDESEWPKEWKEIEYKEYALLPPHALPKKEGVLSTLLKERATVRSTNSTRYTLDDLAYILSSGTGIRDEQTGKRNAPSGGSRYPLETYVVLFREWNGLAAGVYHYSVREHALETVCIQAFTAEDIRSFSAYRWLDGGVGIICLSLVFKRTVAKYGSRGYRYALLEAGHIAQNMLLAGAESGVRLIPIGGVNEEELERRMGLGSSLEKIVYTLFIE